VTENCKLYVNIGAKHVNQHIAKGIDVPVCLLSEAIFAARQLDWTNIYEG
jgi:hypothetical protein